MIGGGDTFAGFWGVNGEGEGEGELTVLSRAQSLAGACVELVAFTTDVALAGKAVVVLDAGFASFHGGTPAFTFLSGVFASLLVSTTSRPFPARPTSATPPRPNTG